MIGSVTTYGGPSLIQAGQIGAAQAGAQIGAAMTYAVSPSANAPSTGDQAQTQSDSQSGDDAATSQAATTATQLAASDITLTSGSMSALIEAQASLNQNAPALIRRHTAEVLGEMIWNLDQAPPLSPAPMAVRRLQAAQAALTGSLVDLQA